MPATAADPTDPTTASDRAALHERAVANQADRVLSFSRRTGRPHLDDADLAVGAMGPRGVFTNQAVVRRPPPDRAGWAGVVARIAAVVVPPAPVLVVSPYDAAEPLGALGFVPVGAPPLMVRPAGGAAPPEAPAELTVAEVVDEIGLEVFERTLVDCYPAPDMQPHRWGGCLAAGNLGGATRFWLGSVAGRPVATAWSHTAAGVTGVEAVATDPRCRGRGYGAAVTWVATRADPTLPAILYASDLGRPVYERMGYEAVARWHLWLRPPAPA